MFFNKAKKKIKRRAEFTKMLSEMAGISENDAEIYFNANIAIIENSYDRGLDTFGVLCYISEKSMERIDAAHMINEIELVEDIPDFMLLVSLQAGKMLSEVLPPAELNLHLKYWNAVLKLPLDRSNPTKTYGDRLHELVADYNVKNRS